MPTAPDILLHPASLAVLALYGALLGREAMYPARTLPRIAWWRTRALAVVVAYGLLAASLPLWWGPLATKRPLFELQPLQPALRAAVAMVAAELGNRAWQRAMNGWRRLWLLLQRHLVPPSSAAGLATPPRSPRATAHPAAASCNHPWRNDRMNRFITFIRQGLAAFGVLLLAAGCGGADDGPQATVSADTTVGVVATGLTNPRGLAFGPDGTLYVAEAGTGGSQVATGAETCPTHFNIYSPYTAGHSGRVLRVRADGTKQVVADGLPSMSDAYGGSFGPTDLAFIGGTLYVLIEMGGCEHGLPGENAAIRRINADGSTSVVADLGAWLEANPPFFVKDTDPTTSDFEPGGVFHSMIAVDGRLYVVETNRGLLLRVDPATGAIERLYDMSIDREEHNPIVVAHRDGQFVVGTFGEDGGPARLAVFGAGFAGYSQPYAARNPLLNPIVGLAWQQSRLFAVEIFPLDNPWSTGTAKLVSFDPASGERRVVLDNFASMPNTLVRGPDGALYTADWASGAAYSGQGRVLRIVPATGRGTSGGTQ
jgi:sugar lactone lactonase YvrE